MALYKCPDCGKDVSLAADRCPACGAPNRQPKPTSKGCLVVAGLLVLLVIAVVLAAVNALPPKPEEENTAFTACYMAQKFVFDRLKAPSTASFSDCTKDDGTGIGTKLTAGDWLESGYVDAQNSFGAKIRSTYTVQLYYDPKDKMWHAESVDIL